MSYSKGVLNDFEEYIAKNGGVGGGGGAKSLGEDQAALNGDKVNDDKKRKYHFFTGQNKNKRARLIKAATAAKKSR